MVTFSSVNILKSNYALCNFVFPFYKITIFNSREWLFLADNRKCRILYKNIVFLKYTCLKEYPNFFPIPYLLHGIIFFHNCFFNVTD